VTGKIARPKARYNRPLFCPLAWQRFPSPNLISPPAMIPRFIPDRDHPATRIWYN
jgi:hypothetical protein